MATGEINMEMNSETRSPTLAQLIKVKRKYLGISQEELADRVNVTARTVERWENGRSLPRIRKHDVLCSALGITNTEYSTAERQSAVSIDPQKALISSLPLEALSLAEIIKRGVDPDKVFRQLGSLIDSWPQPEGLNNFMGDDDAWDEIAKSSPFTHFFLVEDGRSVVAFWSLIPIGPELYQRIFSGENVNQFIGPGDVVQPIPGDAVSLYFVDLFTLRRDKAVVIQEPLVLAKVAETLSRLIRHWAAIDISIERMVAHFSTPEIIRTGDKCGFHPVAKHDCHTMYDYDQIEQATEIHELVIADEVGHNRFLTKIFRDAGVKARRNAS
jgi:transcriptional regulator with XRE-family HTH domain